MPTDAPTIPDVRPMVDSLLLDALRRRASDLHVEPTSDEYILRFRVDGLLETEKNLPSAAGRAVVTRLMVMARLLTYRLDVPQEGRISLSTGNADQTVELRLSVMPTIHGMRAAVRMPAEHVQPAVLTDLALPEPVLNGLLGFAAADCGMLILTGPAGSGKTTTIYALLRHIVQSQRGISIIAPEDPVERDLPGVTQIEVSPFGQLTYEKALRSILRQDPQVLMLGEIRDAATAALAVGAALAGHRLITTLHAATPGGAITRLLEMGIEPYQLTSSLYGIVAQRLVRRKDGDGYRGRLPLAEFVAVDAPLKKAVLERCDADALHKIYKTQTGFAALSEIGQALAFKGFTDAAELHRVIGPSKDAISSSRSVNSDGTTDVHGA
jgi:type II secretory ATPase GspE/PulE/Tfp pilus assembly ATPase PilB-like protein